MRRSAATLDQLFDRTWRPGHPFRPRLSAWRRWGISCLLVVLLGIIAGYWYLTDTARVRRMCEQYLSQLAGGRVQVRHATLSIFEGLRLDDVSLRLDTGQDQTSEPTVFEARSVLIKYNPESILSGRLEATQILVIDPRWRLCENLDTRTWNYHLPVGAGPRRARPSAAR